MEGQDCVSRAECWSLPILRHHLEVPLKDSPIQRKKGNYHRGWRMSLSFPRPLEWELWASVGPKPLMSWVGLREQNQRSRTGSPFTLFVQMGKWRPKGVKQLLKATGLVGTQTHGKNQVSFHCTTWPPSHNAMSLATASV